LTKWIVVALALPAVAQASIVWRGDFETGDTSQWSTRQEVSDDRLLVVTSPHRQDSYALRATVKNGDDPINASGNRNELAYLSLEGEGSESYYAWSTMFADDYPSLDSGQVVTQFHQSEDTGNPPITFYTEGEEFRFYVNGQILWRTTLERGAWYDVILHVKWSWDASTGFVELAVNGQVVVPKTSVMTGTDRYLKQGVYRLAGITPDSTVFHDGMVRATSPDDVAWPSAGAAAATSSAGGTGQADAGASAQVGSPVTDGGSSTGCSVTGGAPSFGLLALVGISLFRRRRMHHAVAMTIR
jgi:MYXO-CTERM domain-containing protein